MQAELASWEARCEEQAALRARLAAAEARQQEQAAALQTDRREVERLQAQLGCQADELLRERGGWLALAARLQAMVQAAADKQVCAVEHGSVCVRVLLVGGVGGGGP